MAKLGESETGVSYNNCNIQSHNGMIEDKTFTSKLDSSNWVNAPEFVPNVNNNLHAKDKSLSSTGKGKTYGPDSSNWVNAPEFVPRKSNFHVKEQHFPFIIKDETCTCSPDSTNCVKVGEFTARTKNQCDKERSFSSTIKNISSTCQNPPNWVNAPEFIPKAKKSFANTLKSSISGFKLRPQKLDMELCMHFFDGKCPYNGDCPCVHGDLCELCHKYCLNPFDEKKRKYHTEYCEKQLEQDMELSFAIQRSLDKTCGICMDTIMEKDPITERRFGILEKCSHVFCLSCIRKWRSVRTLESAQNINEMIHPAVNRACPECRVSSSFITPSQYWVDTKEEKKKLIADYKRALSKTHCKYFKRGKGTCPFGGACFYLHAKRDGTKVDLPVPSRRFRQNQNCEIDFMNTITLWDYLEVRDQNDTFESR